MDRILKVLSPVDNRVFVERKFHHGHEIDQTLARATKAQREWRTISVSERKEYIKNFTDAFLNYRHKSVKNSPGRWVGQSFTVPMKFGGLLNVPTA